MTAKLLRALPLLVLSVRAASAAFTPSSALVFDKTPAEVSAHCRAALARAETTLAAVAKAPARTFENTPAALDRALWDLSDETSADGFFKDVAVSSSVRQASEDCVVSLQKFSIDVFAREDLYKAVKAYAGKKEPLAGENARLLDKELLDFKRSGLELPPARREELTRLRRRIVELQQAYLKNLGEIKTSLLVTRSEIAGLPDDYVARLEKDGDKYKVTLDYPDYFPFMENATDADARRRLEALFSSRAAKENVPLFKEILGLRRQAARLLGYGSHADYMLEDRMAKDAKTVADFLSRLRERLKVLGQKELAVLLELKKKEEGAKSDGILHAWDWRYYDNQLSKTRHQLDQEKIREYFPLETVTEGMLAVYQKLLGVRFRKVPGAAVWAPDVSLYEISDSSGGAVIGHFYMDLFPREGKYKHAASFQLVAGRELAGGALQRPVAAIVANFNKPAPGRPSLLKHGEAGEVETFFHEFGHVMHQTLTAARHGRFSGSNTAQDFVEAPSQMLENWVWDPEVLKSLSGHYQDTSKKLPPELLRKMIAAKGVDVGLRTLRQAFFATVDMRYHAGPVEDTTTVYGELMKEVSLIPMSPGTYPEASFGHLVGGYDAGYYGYLWSKVYAQDMFSVFESAGLLDPSAGRRYREEVLAPGGGRDEMGSLKKFLGREPGEEAFLRFLGLPPKRS